MTIVVAGDGHAEIHEPACAAALRILGHTVVEYYWYPRFRSSSGMGRDEFRSLWLRAQNKFIFGPTVAALNRRLISIVKRERPHVLLLYRATHIVPRTIRTLLAMERRPVIVSLNNDDPFSPNADRLLWRHFKASIRLCDLCFVYRGVNIEDYKRHGARNVHLLRSYFIPWRHFPVEVRTAPLNTDVVFVGHYEPDGRVEYLEAIVRAGFNLRIYGPGWNEVLSKNAALKSLPPVRYLDMNTYNAVLSTAKISLCFLSTINRDTYTRRCFEIAASRGFLLSQYSDDLASLFVEGAEAEFFRTKEELLAKIRHYLANEEFRRAIAAKGRERVLGDGHDVVNRMREAVRVIGDLLPRRTAVLP